MAGGAGRGDADGRIIFQGDAMTASVRTALLLAVAVAGLWVMALRAVPPARGPADGDLRPRGQYLPYPGADRLVMRRVVAEADGFYYPAPDGVRLTHTDAAGDLFILDVRTGESRPAPGGAALREGRSGPGYIFASRMSPDGRRIAYHLKRDGLSALRVLQAEDGSIRELLHHPDSTGWVDLGTWSPDSRKIAVALILDGARNTPGSIVLADAGDGSVERVASFDTRPAMDVTFSPDGRWLAYQRVRSEDSDENDVYIRSVDGGRDHPLTHGPGDHRVAGWLQEGGPFFYLSGAGGRHDLLAVELENGRAVSAPRLVRADLWHAWARGFSGNGFYFVQMPERLKAHTARLDPDAGQLTSPLVPIVPATSMEWTSVMSWSPAGDRMAYMAGNDMVVRSLATGAEHRARTGFSALGIGALAWSSVDERIALQGVDYETGSLGIHLIDITSHSVDLVVPSVDSDQRFQPRWSPDGRTLYIGRRAAGVPGIGIMRFELDSREEREVFRTERYAGFALHPDGHLLAVGQRGASAGAEDRILLVPVIGGEARELARIPFPGTMSRGNACLDWSPDGRYLVVGSNPDAHRRRTLWLVDSDDGRIRELATFTSDGGMQVRPRFHPGGREIAVVAGRNRWEIWTLEQLRPERLGNRRR
jgi:Tol biopolymer transport system component